MGATLVGIALLLGEPDPPCNFSPLFVTSGKIRQTKTLQHALVDCAKGDQYNVEGLLVEGVESLPLLVD